MAAGVIPSALWRYPAPSLPTWQYLPPFQLSFSPPIHLCTSRQWRVAQAISFFSIVEESVEGVIPYLARKAKVSGLLLMQSWTDWGISLTKFLMREINPMRSWIAPLAAFSRDSPTKTTILWAMTSSMQGRRVVGSGSLLASQRPFKACWRISLSVRLGISLELPKTLWPYEAPSKPTWQNLPAFQLLLRSPNHLCTSRQCRVTQAITFFSRAEVSVLLSTPYLRPRFSNSLFPSRQSLTDWGIWSPKPLMRLTRPMRSVTEPLAAFSSTSPTKSTSLWAVASSIQGTMVVGSGSLFCSKRPFSACWRISLSVGLGVLLELPKTLCPQEPPSYPTWQNLPAFQLLFRLPNHPWTSKQWRVTQVMTFFSRAAVSVSLLIPQFKPRASNSLFPSRQSLTDWGI